MLQQKTFVGVKHAKNIRVLVSTVLDSFAPRITHCPPLRGLPNGLHRGLPYGLPPWTTLTKEPNLRLGGKETQDAYLLHLHNNKCMKNCRHFFSDRLPRPSLFFIFAPFLHRPPTKMCFGL